MCTFSKVSYSSNLYLVLSRSPKNGCYRLFKVVSQLLVFCVFHLYHWGFNLIQMLGAGLENTHTWNPCKKSLHLTDAFGLSHTLLMWVRDDAERDIVQYKSTAKCPLNQMSWPIHVQYHCVLVSMDRLSLNSPLHNLGETFCSKCT